MLFAEHPADAAIIEVGLGGRFDATNVISDPAVSVIMPISLDHQPYLGDRVELIAAEKAGIMKAGRPVVIGHQEYDAALDVLISTAERLRCPTAVFGQDFSAHEEYGRLVYQDEFGLADLPLPRLPGRHQYANAAAAIRAVKAAGFTVTEAMMEKAMISVEWPGRLQRLTEGNLLPHAPEGAEIWVDGGHNPGAGEVIAEAMANFEERQPRPLFLIIGMINTKDPVGYFKSFTGLAEKVYCVPIRGSDSMIDPVVLAGAAYDAGLVAEPMSSVGQALERDQRTGRAQFAGPAHPDRRLALSRRRCRLPITARRQSDKSDQQKSPDEPGFLMNSIDTDQAALEIQLCRAVLGAAPTLMSATSPALNMASVGIERTPNWAASSGFSSMLSLATFTLPSNCTASSSRAGAIILHGPHHSAQKSTTTGSAD